MPVPYRDLRENRMTKWFAEHPQEESSPFLKAAWDQRDLGTRGPSPSQVGLPHPHCNLDLKLGSLGPPGIPKDPRAPLRPWARLGYPFKAVLFFLVKSLKFSKERP